MRYLSISEVFELHDRIISTSGGSRGIRDLSALESAVNQPRQSFDQKDLYPDIVTKAAVNTYRDGHENITFKIEKFMLNEFLCPAKLV